jgi:NAD(P)H-hydrate epimerase
MESVDADTIQRGGLPSLVLMENAARSVLPHIPQGPVVVLVGPGNNGGDGLVLARALRETGRDVRGILFSEHLSADAGRQRELANAWGVPLDYCLHDDQALEIADGVVILDALFGTGLARNLTGRYARAIELANRAEAYRLSVDIPSGVDGASGQVLGSSIRAHRTVTFGLLKWGHVLLPGKELCGELILTQPGFHPESLAMHPRVRYVTPLLARELLPSGWTSMHKGDNGRILLVTGSEKYPGAGVLSALGALRGGGGLVTCATDGPWKHSLIAQAPEALLARRSEPLLLDPFNAMVLGCGLGMDTERLGRDLLSRFSGPVVVDADALSLVPEFPPEARRRWILTPHPGELSRLMGSPVTALESNRIKSALIAAARWNAVVCYKGHPTVCASPDGRALVNSTGNPILAQGGSGDVLAGLIGAYLGYGLPELEAAAAAVYVHGLAADLCVRDGAPRGVGARAIAERLPYAFGQAVGKDSLSAVQ